MDSSLAWQWLLQGKPPTHRRTHGRSAQSPLPSLPTTRSPDTALPSIPFRRKMVAFTSWVVSSTAPPSKAICGCLNLARPIFRVTPSPPLPKALVQESVTQVCLWEMPLLSLAATPRPTRLTCSTTHSICSTRLPNNGPEQPRLARGLLADTVIH